MLIHCSVNAAKFLDKNHSASCLFNCRAVWEGKRQLVNRLKSAIGAVQGSLGRVPCKGVVTMHDFNEGDYSSARFPRLPPLLSRISQNVSFLLPSVDFFYLLALQYYSIVSALSFHQTCVSLSCLPSKIQWLCQSPVHQWLSARVLRHFPNSLSRERFRCGEFTIHSRKLEPSEIHPIHAQTGHSLYWQVFRGRRVRSVARPLLESFLVEIFRARKVV